jgi:hypothetical protein
MSHNTVAMTPTMPEDRFNHFCTGDLGASLGQEASIKIPHPALTISTVDAIADLLRDVGRGRDNITKSKERGRDVAKWLLVILLLSSAAFAQEPSDLYSRASYCLGAYQQMKGYMPPEDLQSQYGKDIDQKIQHLQEFLKTNSPNSTADFSMSNKRGRADEAACYECAARVSDTTCRAYSSDRSKAQACMVAQCTPVCALAKRECDKLKGQLSY